MVPGMKTPALLLSLVTLAAACGKDAPAAPPPVAAPAAAAAPTARPAKPVKNDLPPGEATILPVAGPDPCALVGDDVLRQVLGEAPTKRIRQRNNADVLRRDEESSVECEWRAGSAEAT